MQKKDYYNIEKNINKIIKGEYTNFIDPATYNKLSTKLKKIKHSIYSPYDGSDKVIIYTKEQPKVRVIEIISYESLTHREILGSLFGLNITNEMFGDIIIDNNKYYIIVMDSIYELVNNYLNTIGKHSIKLKEVPIETIKDYQKQYEDINLIVSSLRIDNFIAKLIGTSRENIKNKFQNDEIILNYEVCHKINYILKPNDIFSIKKYGKYKFIGITKTSKKGNYIINCQKYI